MRYSIIIPTYNKFHEALEKCLPSVISFTKWDDAEIIIVCNGSNQETKDFIEAYENNFPFIRHLWFDEGLGYAKAVNEGIKISNGEFIVVLNDDTILLGQVQNEWIDKLVSPFLVDKMVGITGPMKVHSPSADKEFIIFFCAMISRKVIEKIGLLDEIFFSYGEDTDMCLRAEKAGFKLQQVPRDSNVYYEPNRMTGDFPIYHQGNISHANWDGGEKLIAKNNQILKERYFNWRKNKNIDKALDVDGFMSKDELHWLASQARKYPIIIECGSWHGRSTRALGDNTCGVVYAIDHWNGSLTERDTHHASAKWMEGDHAYYEFLSNNMDLVIKNKIIQLRVHSKSAIEFFKRANIKADMIFIDAGHTYEEVRDDILNWSQVLKDGGLLCGHDYTHTEIWSGVKKAVDELVPHVKVAPNTSIWYYREIVSGIYKITNPIGRIYIGKSVDIYNRWHTYRRLQCKSQTKLFRSFSKYGVDKHKFEIIHRCSEAELNKMEVIYSETNDCLNPDKGLNLIAGSVGGKMSEEVRKKIGEKSKGRKLSEEHKKAVSLGNKGKVPWNKGKTNVISDEAREQMKKAKKDMKHPKEWIEAHRERMKGRKQSEETIRKRANAHIGMKRSEETRRKISEKAKGRTAPNKGKPHTEETKNKIRKSKNKHKTPIVDCFIFNNETEILLKRFETIFDSVDRFVVVEGIRTHGNKKKELTFHSSIKLFEKYLHKVTYIVVEDFPIFSTDAKATDISWGIERHQRDAIMRGLTECSDSDIIIISDVDEIPNPDAIKRYNIQDGIMAFDMNLYYYNENTKATDKWREAKILPYGLLKLLTPCGARYSFNSKVLENGGNHYSYFGGVDKIIQKIEDTAHQELNTPYFKDPNHIKIAIENGIDLFNRDYVKFESV